MDTKDPLVETAAKELSLQQEGLWSQGMQNRMRVGRDPAPRTSYVGQCNGCDSQYLIEPGSQGAASSITVKSYQCILCWSISLRFKRV